ncbi:MAG: site-specific integrase, partial [Chromatiaceae bacterium]
ALRAARLAAQGEAPTGPDPRQVRTFDELLLAYMREVTPQKGVPERDRYTARHLQPVFTGKPLSQIGVAEVRAYLKSRQAEGAMAGTINKEVGLMSAAINWANRELEWGIPNPWMARRQQEPAGRTRWLTEEEVDRLLTAARAGRAKWHLPAYILLCLHAGLRSNEALHLEWSRVDLGRNRLHLGATDQKNARVSEIPINASARAALIERASFRAVHCPDTPWVFSRRSGIRIGAVKHGFALAVAAAGLKDCHPHDLRRTCGSWLVQAGVGIERVAMILRHSDVRVTARVYAHLRHADLADDITALDRRAAGNKISRDDFTLAI